MADDYDDELEEEELEELFEEEDLGEDLLEEEDLVCDPIGGASCRVCGCTDDKACPGGCVWAEPDLCSRCYLETQAQGGGGI